ncbi:McrB family protein [Mycobacterium sp. NPDC048908]|uniref:McrB family protein n=1 Tax=Mycobacterium sp. NPDC048908 TaxID=3364292 RepID=UPI00372372AB
MLAIPTLKFSYGNLLLARLRDLGSANINELLGEDPAHLFKSGGRFENPERRARDCLRFAQMLDLVVEDKRGWMLTESGNTYADNVDPRNPWVVNDTQAGVLRDRLSGDSTPLASDVRIALQAVRDLAPGFSTDDLGRALEAHADTGQWQADRTFESQGARYRELLIESGLIDRNGGITDQGVTFLGRQASVWWVNQGATYTKERDGGFLWAPMLNKAGRPQYHWDTMDEVREGDVVLHYSNGSLRAASHVSAAARPAPNPLDDQSWDNEGRLVESQYQELNEPVALGAIDEGARIRQGSPFTVTGSVQQVYLVRLQGHFVKELAGRFPELAAHLPSAPAGPGSTPTLEKAAMPAELFSDFAVAVEVSGLRFPAGSNLVRSFLAGLLAKPFAILTGLAGSGKTQLAMRLGEWFGTDEHGRHRHIVVPVRPDWTGPESIFGYEDALRTSASGAPVWFVPEAFEFVLRAASDPEHPYLLILDEMNLAHVERYFSDFLSGVESRRPVLPDLVFEQPTRQWVLRDVEAQRLSLPRNLFVVGTVNVDETTYMFSPKVLDRAFTYEFRVTADELDADLRRPTAAQAGEDRRVRAFASLAESDDWQREHPHPARDEIVLTLREVHAILARANQEFGHRTLYEILRFCAFYAATGHTDGHIALDLAMMQKVLPKVHGSRRQVEPVLTALDALAQGAGPAPQLPVTHQKIVRMIESVRANQFVSFAE